jgi:antitoxin (DNA-binding transcriptional repressor) of toxin-antitoxin stability system
MIESMAAVHMTEADLVRDIASVMDRVQSGEEIIIERDARPLAVLRAATPRRRKLSEIMAALPEDSEARPDADFATEPSVGMDVQVIKNRVQAMNEDQLLARYHDLVDKRLMNQLDYQEIFELDFIDARLDDDDEFQQIKAVEKIWTDKRTELIGSFKELVSRLEAR